MERAVRLRCSGLPVPTAWFGGLAALLAVSGLAAEPTWEYAVRAEAQVQAAPPQIRLHWPQDSVLLPQSYRVFRKFLWQTNWGDGVLLPATATNFLDTNVLPGFGYEYQIVKHTSRYTGYGYVYAGINVPLTEDRGKLVLVVDSTYAENLCAELARLEQDLAGDGWTVVRLDVERSDSATHVKQMIRQQYAADPERVKCVFLFGHVPVAYSGNIVPDGHAPDHQGAWPCDGFYGDMDGLWTDDFVNVSCASDPRNRNVPGDGKFDQSSFPAPLKLMVGRVDLSNLPGRQSWGGPAQFPSEVELLRNYLNKNHRYRTKEFQLPCRAILGDFFGLRSGEGFAASGWRNLSALVGLQKVTSVTQLGTWTPNLRTNEYLWAYGCGAGSYTSVAGLGNSTSYNDVTTTELYTNDVKAVFTMLFGSWLGDWDSEDNIQRCVLAMPSYSLACAWSGRPHWFLHHMALGEPIGFGTLLTQNNGPGGLYRNEVNSAAGQIQIALMGDPTLRMHVVAPPASLQITTNSGAATLQWEPSTEPVLGYHVYSLEPGGSCWKRLTSQPCTATQVELHGAGANYLVRAVRLETSASGTYYNLSQGEFLKTPVFPRPVPTPALVEVRSGKPRVQTRAALKTEKPGARSNPNAPAATSAN